MPYAVFEDGERLTRVFVTEEQAWQAAERAGLVETTDGKKFSMIICKYAPAMPNPKRAVTPSRTSSCRNLTLDHVSR
jgi:hypothetical protein